MGIPGKWSTETLADEVEARTGVRLVIDMTEVSFDLAAGRLDFRGENLCELDALIVKKISADYSPATLDRLELLRVAERAGVRVFSGAERMLRLIDRLSCTVTLSNGGVPMPATRITEDVEQAMAAVREFGAVILKPLYSTKARGMCVVDIVDGEAAARSAIETFKRTNPVMYLQQRIELPGQDLGLVFLGGDYLGCYARVPADAAWNTTIHSGGRYASYQPDAALIEMASRAQALFDMDFTTVDVAETSEGPVVFEVSAFGGFRGAKEGIGLNVAARYTDYVLEQLT